MRVLVLYAHPVETSFHAALHGTAVAALREAGHEVDDCDLYAEGFDPVLSRGERLQYHDVATNRTPVARYVERLLAAEALVLCYPVWCFGMPAMLKGFLDRVMLPGVAFVIENGKLRTTLDNIRTLAVVTTYGQPRWMAFATGDPPRKVVKNYLRRVIARRPKVRYVALYHMNRNGPKTCEAFLARARREMLSL